MTGIKAQLGAIAATFVVLGFAVPTTTVAEGAPTRTTADDADFSARARGGGGGIAGAGGGRNVNVNRNINRNTNVNRNANRNVNVNRNVDVNRRTNIVVRPVRPWVPRPYFGTVVGGIALGTVIAATAVGVAPAAPAPNMCWFWSDSARSQGYWDYCTPPQ